MAQKLKQACLPRITLLHQYRCYIRESLDLRHNALPGVWTEHVEVWNCIMRQEAFWKYVPAATVAGTVQRWGLRLLHFLVLLLPL